MKDQTFKMPLYWGKLWEGLTNTEVGLILKAVFLLVLTGNDEIPEDLSPKAVIACKKCLEDVRYQFDHPRCYKKPDDAKEIRNCKAYRMWRAAVYERDEYTCQNCGKVGGRLNAHHIKTFARHPELRFSTDNGITLCESCHKLAHRKRVYE